MQSFIKIGAVVFELSCGQNRQTNRQTGKRRAKYNLLAQVKSHITLLGFQNKTKHPQFVSTIANTTFQDPITAQNGYKAVEWMNEWMKKRKLKRIRFKPMFLLSLLTNEDSYNTQIYNALTIQYSETVPGIGLPGFGTGSGTWEPVPWNRFLRQITSFSVSLQTLIEATNRFVTV